MTAWAERGCYRQPSLFAGVSSRTVAPFLLPAHQIGRAEVPDPAFRLASTQSTRRSIFNTNVGRQHPDRDRPLPAVQLPPTLLDLYGAERHEASHLSLAASKAHQKSDSFVPLGSPGISARTTLSGFRLDRL